MCTGVEVALIVGAAGAAAGVYSGVRQRSAQRKQSRLQRKMEARQARQQRIEQLRASQRATATVQAQAASSGVLSSSGTAGGVASIRAQAMNNISFINEIEALQDESRKALEEQRDWAFKGQAAQQVANLAANAASMGGGAAPKSSPRVPAGSQSAAQDPFSSFNTTQQSIVPFSFS